MGATERVRSAAKAGTAGICVAFFSTVHLLSLGRGTPDGVVG
jgi:hypothetical protein